jgi:hypothetical protein
MSVKIKPKRGTGSPAGSLETNEIAMDTTNRKVYVSTDGSNAVVLADDTQTYLDTVNLVDYNGDTPTDINLGSCQVGTGAAGERLELTGGSSNIRIKSAVDAQANNITTTGTITGGTLAGTNGNITTVTATTLSGTTVQSESGNDLTIFPNDDQKLVLKNTNSSDTAQIDITYNGSNQFDIDADTTSNKRIALKGDRASLQAPGSSGNTDITCRSDRIVMGVDNVLYATLRSDQVQLSKDLDLNGVNIIDANEIRGQSGGNLELKTLGTNNIILTSTNDIDLAVGAVTTDNVNISGKTNITGDNSQPHTLKVLTDMNDSASDDIHNSQTYVLQGYLNSGNGIKNNVQNSVTYQVESDTETFTVGRVSAEFQSNGVGNRMKMISVNNGAANNDGNAEGAIGNQSTDSPNGNGQIDIDSQRFKSNVPVLFPSYTTTERGTLHNIQNGMVIYNTTDHKLQVRANGSWVDLH